MILKVIGKDYRVTRMRKSWVQVEVTFGDQDKSESFEEGKWKEPYCQERSRKLRGKEILHIYCLCT